MRKGILISAAVCALLTLIVQPAFPNGNPNSDICVSPQTFLLSMPQGGSVTVHTNIPYARQSNVMLESVPARYTFADNRGHLVAKFSEDAVEAIVAPPRAVLTLYIDGDDVGSDAVRVLE